MEISMSNILCHVYIEYTCSLANITKNGCLELKKLKNGMSIIDIVNELNNLTILRNIYCAFFFKYQDVQIVSWQH